MNPRALSTLIANASATYAPKTSCFGRRSASGLYGVSVLAMEPSYGYYSDYVTFLSEAVQCRGPTPQNHKYKLHWTAISELI